MGHKINHSGKFLCSAYRLLPKRIIRKIIRFVKKNLKYSKKIFKKIKYSRLWSIIFFKFRTEMWIAKQHLVWRFQNSHFRPRPSVLKLHKKIASQNNAFFARFRREVILIGKYKVKYLYIFNPPPYPNFCPSNFLNFTVHF